jgi:endonuclease/exonuclease/phosphatase family metal-dependent hydrolase
VRRQPEQAARIAAVAPDLVCLQEVTAATAQLWTQQLGDAGLEHVALGDAAGARNHGRRPLMTLTAGRHPLAAEPVPGVPWPERALAVSSDGLLTVNLHSPISARPDLVKVLTHEAVHARLAGRAGPTILCGDLNTPRREHPDGRVWTFARTAHGNLRPERGERWDRAELALIRGLEPYGFRDAFRERHGPEVRELSWEWTSWKGGYRLDHLIVSAELEVNDVCYLHVWRREGLSDHSPLLAELAWTPS